MDELVWAGLTHAHHLYVCGRVVGSTQKVTPAYFNTLLPACFLLIYLLLLLLLLLLQTFVFYLHGGRVMGNCQAIDAAALVIQHPCGRIERLYWTVSAGEVMRLNPGHYVSLIIPLPISEDHDAPPDNKTVRFTRVKLLRPTDTLLLGHAYRLITSQEVMKVLRAKKHAKMKKDQLESAEKLPGVLEERQSTSREEDRGRSEMENSNQVVKHERHRPRTASMSSAATAARSKSWRPSLQSISEAGS